MHHYACHFCTMRESRIGSVKRTMKLFSPLVSTNEASFVPGNKTAGLSRQVFHTSLYLSLGAVTAVRVSHALVEPPPTLSGRRAARHRASVSENTPEELTRSLTGTVSNVPWGCFHKRPGTRKWYGKWASKRFQQAPLAQAGHNAATIKAGRNTVARRMIAPDWLA